ncbi:unnamed protein product [Phaeothamnion confervicola]
MQDPIFSREDAMVAAAAEGHFARASKLQLEISKMKLENPFRQEPMDGYDPAEDMSWGFDESFHQDPAAEKGGDDSDEAYSDI